LDNKNFPSQCKKIITIKKRHFYGATATQLFSSDRGEKRLHETDNLANREDLDQMYKDGERMAKISGTETFFG